MRPIVFLNGPPGCGKDTLGNELAKTQPDFKVVKFAKIMKERTHAAYGHGDLSHDYFEKIKDKPHDIFLGVTPREAYIAMSEKLMKPMHGPGVFGEFLLDELIQDHETKAFVVTDSGFTAEAYPLIKHFQRKNCLLIRIHAEARGCSFKGDSRNYINLEGVETFDVSNNGKVEDFLFNALFLLSRVFIERGDILEKAS